MYDYIPDDLINSPKFLALLENYSSILDSCLDNELQSFVEKAVKSYRKQIELTSTTSTRKVDKTDETENPDGHYDGFIF